MNQVPDMTGLTPEQIVALMNTDANRKQVLGTNIGRVNDMLNARPELEHALTQAQTIAQLAGAQRDLNYQPSTPSRSNKRMILSEGAGHPKPGTPQIAIVDNAGNITWHGDPTPKDLREGVNDLTPNQRLGRQAQYFKDRETRRDQIRLNADTPDFTYPAARGENAAQLQSAGSGLETDNILFLIPDKESNSWYQKYFGDPNKVQEINLEEYNVGGVPLTLEAFKEAKQKSGWTTQRLLRYLIDPNGEK